MTLNIELINLGSGVGSGDGDGLRTAFEKINNNFEILQSPIKVFVGLFTPTTIQEYPSDSPFATQTWLITGIDEIVGYTFLTKNLIGQTIYNGNELYYDGTNWAILKTNSRPYLLSDGSVKMDSFYTPTDPKDIVTVDFLTNLETQISLFEESIILLNTAVSEKAEAIHSHVKSDITDADWLSCVCEDLNPQLGGNLDLNNKTLFSSFDDTALDGSYGFNFQNVSGNSEFYLTSESAGDLFSFSLSSSGNSAIISSKDLIINAGPSSNIILDYIKIPSQSFSQSGQILVSGESITDELIWEDFTKVGTTLNRPTSPKRGEMYFDTDLEIPVWNRSNANGDVIWIDAVGAPV